jgi:hypothetical protein
MLPLLPIKMIVLLSFQISIFYIVLLSIVSGANYLSTPSFKDKILKLFLLSDVVIKFS